MTVEVDEKLIKDKLEKIRYKVPDSAFEALSNAFKEIIYVGAARRTPIIEFYSEKYGIEIGEEVEYEDFMKIIDAIKNDNSILSPFMEKIKKTFNVGDAESAILFLLYASNNYIPATHLYKKFDETFSNRMPLSKGEFEEKLLDLEEMGIIEHLTGGWIIKETARKKIEKLYRKSVKKKLLKESFIVFDVPDDEPRVVAGLKKFFREFIDEGGRIKYLELINMIILNSKNKIVPVDYEELSEVLPRFSKKLLEEPDEMLDYMNKALQIVILDEFGVDNVGEYKVGIKNLPVTLMPREARGGEYISKLVQIEGIVVRATELKPFTKTAAYICRNCGYVTKVPQNPFKLIEKPRECPACGDRRLEFDESRSVFEDIQYIKIQDFPDKLRGGDLPKFVYVALLGHDLIDRVKPGDKAVITGIVRIDKTQRNKTPVMEVIVEALWAESENKDFYEIEITPEEEKKIKEIAKRKDVIKLFRDSLAPKVYGYKMEKTGIVLSLFGGVPWVIRGVRYRGDIHVLLFGEPGTAKTKLLYAAKAIAPRSVFVSCNGATKAGIGAAAVRDEHTGEWVLDAGAFVIADLGFVFMDEMDKLTTDAKNVLHEILENQEISVAKAGIVATLNTRATMLATANPKDGRFNKKKTIAEQINLPDTLLSRMDLIFVFEDKPKPDRDAKIADVVLNEDVFDVEEGVELLDPEFMMKYIAYARQHVFPKLSKEAIEKIKKYYVELRKRGLMFDNEYEDLEYRRIPITARQLEAIKRLTQAAARARLSDVATAEDAQLAIDIMEYVFRKLIVDEEGEFDISMLEVGKSAKKLSKLDKVREVIRKLEKEHENDKGVPHSEIVEKCKELGITEIEVNDLLEKLTSTGEVWQPRTGYYRMV